MLKKARRLFHFHSAKMCTTLKKRGRQRHRRLAHDHGILWGVAGIIMKNLRCRRDWIVSENMRYKWIQYLFQWVQDMRASRLWQDQRPKSVTTTCATSATVFAEVRCSQWPDLKRKRKKHRRLNSTSLCFFLFLFPTRSMPSALSTALSVSYTFEIRNELSSQDPFRWILFVARCCDINDQGLRPQNKNS